MNPLARWTRAASVGVVLLAVGVLGACGDDGDDKDSSDDGSGGGGLELSGPPDDASEEDFCEAALDQPGDNVDAIHDWAGRVEEIGTPEGIPDDAREGFELLVETAKEIDEDDLENEDLVEEFSEDEQDAFEAYITYVTQTCTPEVPEPEVT